MHTEYPFSRKSEITQLSLIKSAKLAFTNFQHTK